ncbi:MAG: Holliday junction branch migration protein RuvA [Oligoflexia bacterium]|jgi:Holliday junction DNA helicase RuvA
MIGFLRGEVLDLAETRVTLLVAGVGYQVQVAAGPEVSSLAVGSKLELHIHTHVREDALDLYGFFDRTGKALFLKLLGVSGIGPKGAMAMLSGLSTSSLVEAILTGDVALLTKIPGVGKKTAERVVLELGDTLKKPEWSQVASARARLSGGVLTPGVLSDAHEALVQLGFRDADVGAVLKRLEAEKGAEKPKTEDYVRWGLQQLR